MHFDHSEETQSKLLDLASQGSNSLTRMDFAVGELLGELMAKEVETARRAVQIVIRAADYDIALGVMNTLGTSTDAGDLPADIAVTCYWNRYHRLSSEGHSRDIAPLQRETHSIDDDAVDVSVVVTSGLSEPAAISGNLRRVRERYGAEDVVIIAPTATKMEIDMLEKYLYDDRILDARLLLGVHPLNARPVRRRLPERASASIPDDTFRYPGELHELREQFLLYRAQRLASELGL